MTDQPLREHVMTHHTLLVHLAREHKLERILGADFALLVRWHENDHTGRGRRPSHRHAKPIEEAVA